GPGKRYILVNSELDPSLDAVLRHAGIARSLIARCSVAWHYGDGTLYLLEFAQAEVLSIRQDSGESIGEPLRLSKLKWDPNSAHPVDASPLQIVRYRPQALDESSAEVVLEKE